MVWLPDGEKILKICLFVLTECTYVTDRETDTQTDGHRMTATRQKSAGIFRSEQSKTEASVFEPPCIAQLTTF